MMYGYDTNGVRKFLHKFRDPIAGVIKLSDTDALVFSKKSQIAYISQELKLWEGYTVPHTTLASVPAISKNKIAFNFHTGGFQIYSI